MIVVIDPNVLPVSISSRSAYHWLYKLILTKKIRVALSQDILSEYEEQISKHWNSSVAAKVIRSLTELSTTLFTNVFYNLKLIKADPDDDKFVDCAFAANADYIITNDKHFNVLKDIDFPTIPTVSIDQFSEIAKF